MDEVVVTGHKDINSAGQVSITANAGLLGNRDQFETPFSQASYTEKLVLDQQARTLDEVLDNNSSIRDTANSYTDAEQLNIRGFSSQPQSVLFNGIPGLLSARRVPVEGVARVDVLLGPSALLYNGVGDQNVGGVINIQPKRADATPLNRLTASYVSDTSVELQGDVGRRFGPDGAFGVRANLAGLTGDSPVDNQYQLVKADLRVWAAGVKAPPFLQDIDGLETNRGNQIVVRPTLQSTRDDRVMAIGDCCSMTLESGKPVPPRAQAAHQMADTAFHNLQALMENRPLRPFVYHDHGSLVSLSRFSTVGSLMGNLVGGRMAIEGRLARLAYISLYRMHLIAIHGWLSGVVLIAVSKINNVVRPRLKLH